jgi:hypothetical protein
MSTSLTSLLVDTVPLALATNGGLPTMAQVVMLQARHPRRNGTAFVFGYALVITAVVVLGNAVLNGRVRAGDTTDRELSIVNVVAGLGLVLFAIGVRVRSRRHPSDPAEPRFVQKLRNIGPLHAAAAGVLVPTYPPAIAAATVFARSEAPNTDRLVVLVVFVVLATLSGTIPLACYLLAPAWSTVQLARIMAFLLRHKMALAFWALLALGLAIVARELIVVDLR